MKRLLSVALLVSLLATPVTWAQEASTDEGPTPIMPGQTVSDSLATGESHTYTVDLDAGQFAYGNVEQRTVDVVVNVYGPDGTALDTYDALGRWPEPFHLRSDTAGVHRIKVTPYEEDQGRYAISLKRIEPVATAPEARVDQLIAAYDGDDVPGGIVGVIRDGEVAFARAYGMADLAHGIPITTETRFNLGSASKQFLGFAFALLAERDQVSLDDPVQNYLPDWPTFEQTVTLRHLLSHTSGYREAYGTQHVAGRIPGEDLLPREEALEAVRRQPTLEFPAGSEFQYNSLAYVILAEVLKEVTGTPAATWVEENVFGPLGMDQSAIESEVGEVIPNAAHSYAEAEDGGGSIREFSNRAIFGAAEVYTTVGDLANWFRNFQTAELGGRAVQERLREPFVLTTGETTNYGLGLTVDEHRGLRRIRHGGVHAGFGALLVYYPELDAGVVVMQNGPRVSGITLSNRVAEIAFGEHMEPKPIDVLADQDRAPLDSTRLARYAGKYRAEDGGVYTIERTGDTLSVGGEFDLVPRSDSVFYVKGWRYQRAVFHQNDGGGQRASLYDLNEPTHLRRMEPWTPAVQELEAFAGQYHSAEVQTRYTISLADSQLVAKHPRHGTMPLKPVEKDAFQMANGVQIQFERTDTGLVTGYYASFIRTRDIWFQKIE